MKINTRLYFTSYVSIAFILVTVTALIGSATAEPQDGPTKSPMILDTARMMHEGAAAVVGSNPLTFSNSTIGDSSEIDLSLLQIIQTTQ